MIWREEISYIADGGLQSDMKKQLDYFEIEGEFGGNQDWFTNVVMHIGGCAAATACDSCIYFAREEQANFHPSR